MVDLFRRKSVVQNPGTGSSVCIWGPVGSPGKTTLAINIACELALAGKRALLIDLDTYVPSVAQALGLAQLQPGLAAAARLVGQGRLDQSQLDRLAFSYEVGNGRLSVLAGLGASARWPEISSEKTQRLITIASEYFDHVIVDVGSPLEPGVRQIGGVVERNSAARAAIEACDSVVAVFAADTSGVSRFLDSYEEFEALRGDAILVANRLRASALGQRPRQQIEDTIMQFCRREVDAFIDSDAEACDRASLETVPLAMMKRSSKARQAIAQFVRLNILNQVSIPSKLVAKLD